MTIRAVVALTLTASCFTGPADGAAALQAEPGCTTPEAGACAHSRGERVRTWRQVATEDDRRRIREWRSAFVDGLAEARRAGHGDEIAREGALLDPDAALPGAALLPGDYRCRTIKLGTAAGGPLAYVAYPAFRCRVAPGRDGQPRLTKLDGSQRPIGRLFDEHDRRQIFLGTLQLGDETGVLSYNRDHERNMAGLVERVGERRWRLLLPYPHFESTLDVIELVPAP